MNKPPYRCASGDIANIDEEATFDVSTIVVDTGWVVKSDLVMVDNPMNITVRNLQVSSTK